MPTAIEFDLAAVEFDNAADAASALLAGIGDSAETTTLSGTLSGGTLTLLTTATVTAAGQTAQAVAAELRELATECRRRAELCRVYVDDLVRYDRAVDRWREERATLPPGEPAPRRPTRPQSPGAWAEV